MYLQCESELDGISHENIALCVPGFRCFYDCDYDSMDENVQLHFSLPGPDFISIIPFVFTLSNGESCYFNRVLPLNDS